MAWDDDELMELKDKVLDRFGVGILTAAESRASDASAPFGKDGYRARNEAETRELKTILRRLLMQPH